MSSMGRFFWIISLATALSFSAVAGEQPYKFLSAIPIGGEGGWDILTIDSDAQRLYLSHATKVEVVDIATNKVVGAIADTPGVHEFLAIPAIQRGFSSNGKEDKCSVVDLKTFQTITKVPTGESPDAMAYDQDHHELYVFNHRGNSVTVIDAVNAKVTSTIPLPGNPEFAVCDPVAQRVYCNIEDKNEVAVIDTAKKQVVATWPLAPGEEPTGIALDGNHHRLFASCQRLLVMLQSDTGKVIATVPTGSGVDGCVFDEDTQLAFASCGEGLTTIAKAFGADKLVLQQSLKTERGARTIALDPKTHRIFLPVAQFGPAPSPAPGATPGRPSIVPNTLKLLVYGPSNEASN